MNPTTSTLMKRLAIPGAVFLASASLSASDILDKSEKKSPEQILDHNASTKYIFSGVGVITGISAMLIVFSVWQIERKH